MAPLRIAAIVLALLWALGVETETLGRSVHWLAALAAALLIVDFVKRCRVKR